MFDIFNVNLRKNEGFLTCIPCNPIPEYGQSNAPLVMASDRMRKKIKDYAEIFGRIMRKHGLMMRKLHRIMRTFQSQSS